MTASFTRGPGLVAPDPSDLVAEITPVDPGAPTPLAAAAAGGHLVGGHGRTVAALGTAAVLGLPSGLAHPEGLRSLTAWLRAVQRSPEGEPGQPWVTAVGALPFDPSMPVALVVPESTWLVDAEDRGWRLDVRPRHRGPAGAAPRIQRHGGLVAPAPGEPELTEFPSGEGYADTVARALSDIAAGRLRKVVLSRTVDVRLPAAPSPEAVLEDLWGGDPAFRPYSVPVGARRMVGASPELLVGRRGSRVVSHAFAGTVGLTEGDPRAVERLLASAKDRDEHRFVVEAIAHALAPRCTELEVPDAPSVVRLRSDARLGSLLEGTLRNGDGALELLGLLHPTPAVCGVPSARALQRITELEPPRGYWAGAVGWIDGAGDGDWVLAIRSAILDGCRAVVRAGAGIVAGSDPRSELAETTIKLAPVLEALWPGASKLL